MTHDYDPDVLLIEIIRVTEAGSRWIKNGSQITFPTVGVNLPNFSRFYRVVGTCHHNGSLTGGHWLTKACTTRGWYELDDLKPGNTATNPPGDDDGSVVLILLLVDNRMA
jgi:ubiquitin C-terminal hydrolase